MQEGLRSCVFCRKVHVEGLVWRHKGCGLVVHGGSSQAEMVVHADPVVVHGGSSRHGKYRDEEGRREYRRNWMRAKRAEARKGV